MGHLLLVFAAIWLLPFALMLGLWSASSASPGLRRTVRAWVFGPDAEPAPAKARLRPRREERQGGDGRRARPAFGAGRQGRVRSATARRLRRRPGQ